MSAAFWNGILADHAKSATVAERVTKAVTPDQHRGWAISWDYGQFTATGPDYDASWEGEEDGWVDNGHRVFARTRDELIAEIDDWFEARDGEGSAPHALPGVAHG